MIKINIYKILKGSWAKRSYYMIKSFFQITPSTPIYEERPLLVICVRRPTAQHAVSAIPILTQYSTKCLLYKSHVLIDFVFDILHREGNLVGLW